MRWMESETIELKSVPVADICKEIVAFANTKGGTLYIGVDDDGTAVGVDDIDRVVLQINNMVRDGIKPDVTMFVGYECQEVDAKRILAVTVQKGTDRPYYLGAKGLKPGGVYVRNGTSTDPATDTAIRKMIKETDGDSFESMRSLEQQLSFHAAKTLFDKRDVPFDRLKMQTLGLVSPDGMYSNVALLLSDQCPSTIKAAVFAGADRSVFQDRREFSGSLFDQMQDVYAYLDLHNQTRATFEGLYRTDVKDYPPEALREALMNTLVHRDYAYSAGTLVSIYDDRMEFVSIGGLPDGIGLDDIMLGLSVCRNPKLAAVFYRLQLIEAYGTGIPKIMTAYAQAEVKPTIQVTSNAFKITLPNRNAVNATRLATVSARSPEEKIMDFLSHNGRIVRDDVEDLLDVSQATAGRLLNRLVKDGVIVRDGLGKQTGYKRGGGA